MAIEVTDDIEGIWTQITRAQIQKLARLEPDVKEISLRVDPHEGPWQVRIESSEDDEFIEELTTDGRWMDEVIH